MAFICLTVFAVVALTVVLCIVYRDDAIEYEREREYHGR